MKKKLIYFSALGAILMGIMFLFVKSQLFMGIQMGLQNKFYDFANPSPEIVIIGIDEKTLDEYGQLTKWPRADTYAKAISILNENEVKVIGIDITFPDVSLETINSLKKPRTPRGKNDDEAFADILRKTDNVVLAGRYYFQNGRREAEFPNEILMDSKPDVGWINVNLDSDGFVRKIPIYAAVKNTTAEAFSLLVSRKYLAEAPKDYVVRDGEFSFSEDTNIPVITLKDKNTGKAENFMYINYSAEPERYTRISMKDLLDGNFKDGNGNTVILENKIVLIGPTARDLGDYYNSPVSMGVEMPGVEVHANNIQTIIEKKFIRDQSVKSLWAALAGILVLNILIFSTFRVLFAVPIAVLEFFGVIIAGIAVYESRILMNVVYPIILIILSFAGTFILRYILAQKEKKFVESAFSHYVNKSVVDQIMKNPDMLNLGGARREVTAFFSDIADFTSLSEKMEPEKMVQFLNRYMDEMSNIILIYQGTLDKYEGDAIMAFWNAPLPVAEHAKNACIAALENQKRLALLREEWRSLDIPQLYARIGIHTGDVIAGNMGSQKRFDYTIIGDNVNIASRLEGINKQYDTSIIISESTYARVKDDFACRELDVIRVKGREHPIRIFELISKKDETAPEAIIRIRAFHEALSLYRVKDFISAREKFNAIQNDRPSKVFAERCADFIKTPPAQEWDGVYVFATK